MPVLTLVMGVLVACSSPQGSADLAAIAAASAASGMFTCSPEPSSRLEDGTVFLVPGETLCVRLKVSGSLASPVEFVVGPASGDFLVLQSWGRGGPEVYLAVHNPFSSSINYRAGFLYPGELQFRATSSCTVLPGRFVLEHWPHPIEMLALRGFELQPAGDNSTICR